MLRNLASTNGGPTGSVRCRCRARRDIWGASFGEPRRSLIEINADLIGKRCHPGHDVTELVHLLRLRPFTNRLRELADFLAQPRNGRRRAPLAVSVAIRPVDHVLQLGEIHHRSVDPTPHNIRDGSSVNLTSRSTQPWISRIHQWAGLTDQLDRSTTQRSTGQRSVRSCSQSARRIGSGCQVRVGSSRSNSLGQGCTRRVSDANGNHLPTTQNTRSLTSPTGR